MSILDVSYFYRVKKPHFLYTKETLDEFNQYIDESLKELQDIAKSEEPDVHKFVMLCKANFDSLLLSADIDIKHTKTIFELYIKLFTNPNVSIVQKSYILPNINKILTGSTVFTSHFDWKRFYEASKHNFEQAELSSISSNLTQDYESNLENIYVVMPPSEINNVIEYFRIPDPTENCSLSFLTFRLYGLTAFLPKTAFPFEIIDRWVNLFIDYHIKYSELCANGFEHLIRRCIEETPEYDWIGLFSRYSGDIYSVFMGYSSLSAYIFPYDKPLESTHIRPLLQNYIRIFKLAPSGSLNVTAPALLSTYRVNFCDIIYFLLKLKIYKEMGKNINYFDLTAEEVQATCQIIWSTIEVALVNMNMKNTSISMYEYFSIELLPKLLRCIEEGLDEDNCMQTNRIITAIIALEFGNQIYIFPHPNSEYISYLLSSLNFLYDCVSTIDHKRLIASIRVFSGLYRLVNLSKIEELYKDDNPLIQSQMVQLFEWLKSHAVDILFNIALDMKITQLPWNDTVLKLFPVILTTLPQEDIDNLFQKIIDEVLDDLEHGIEMTFAISEVAAFISTKLHAKAVDKIFERLVENNSSFCATKDTIIRYCNILDSLLSPGVRFTSSSWDKIKIIFDIGIKYPEMEVNELIFSLLYILTHQIGDIIHPIKELKKGKIGEYKNFHNNYYVYIDSDSVRYQSLINDITQHYTYPQIKYIYNLIDNNITDRKKWTNAILLLSSSVSVDFQSLFEELLPKFIFFKDYKVRVPNLLQMWKDVFECYHRIYLFIDKSDTLTDQILVLLNDKVLSFLYNSVFPHYNINNIITSQLPLSIDEIKFELQINPDEIYQYITSYTHLYDYAKFASNSLERLLSKYFYFAKEYLYRHPTNEYKEVMSVFAQLGRDVFQIGSRSKSGSASSIIRGKYMSLYKELDFIPDECYKLLVNAKHTESLIFLQGIIDKVIDYYYNFSFIKKLYLTILDIPKYLLNYPQDKVQKAEDIILSTQLSFYIIPGKIQDINEYSSLFAEITKDFQNKQWRYQSHILFCVFINLLTGIEPNYCIGDIIADGVTSENPNIRVVSSIFSGFIARFYPNIFGDKLRKVYNTVDTWLNLYESFINFSHKCDEMYSGHTFPNYFQRFDMNNDVKILLDGLCAVENDDYYNRNYSFHWSVSYTVCRLCKFLGYNDIIKMCNEAGRLFLNSCVDRSHCSILCHILSGFFSFGIKQKILNDKEFLSSFLDFFDFLVEKSTSCIYVPSYIFQYQGKFEDISIFPPLVRELTDRVNNIKDKENNVNKISTYITSCKICEKLSLFYISQPEIVIEILKPLLYTISNLFTIKDNNLLSCICYVLLASSRSPFNDLNVKDNELSVLVSNINDKISILLDDYINKYKNENGFVPNVESKDNLLFHHIVSGFGVFFRHFKPISYLYKLIIPLARSYLSNESRPFNCVNYSMCLTSIMPEDDFWNILQSLLNIESSTVRKGTVVMLQIILSNCSLLVRDQFFTKLLPIIENCLYDNNSIVRQSCDRLFMFLFSFYTENKLNKTFKKYEKMFNKALQMKKNKDNDWIRYMHGCVIVLTSFLNLNLVEIESYTPKALELLLTVSSYPAPIGKTSKDSISKFKKSHQDDWDRCKKYFSEDQIALLEDTLVSSHYFA